MALGAHSHAVVSLVVRHGLSLAAIGLGVGWFAAALLTRTLSGRLYGVTPTDLVTHVLVAGLLLCVALVASGPPPAWRASRVSPLDVLRQS